MNASAKPEYAKGLEGVIASETGLSRVDGTEGKLFYRGIPIHELAENSNFEETVYLLWNGKLPGKKELETFCAELIANRAVPGEVIAQLKSFPKDIAHPMAVLRSVISMLGLFDPDADNLSQEALKLKAVRLTAAFPTVIAAYFRIREGKEPVAPKAELSHAANFLYMMHGEIPKKEMSDALDVYLILLADHGFNASTFSARVTTSTEADMYSAITAAIGTLKGPLHGSAIQKAMEMILEIGSPDKAKPYVDNLLAQKKKVMGFGHRVYKTIDPRAEAFRGIARKMCDNAGDPTWMLISENVEKHMMETKGIACNVDFFSASVIYTLGFPIDFFTTVFAASRIAGWTGHVIEQHQDNRLMRPKALYVGLHDQAYVPLEKR